MPDSSFHALFDASPQPQVQVALSGQILRANPALALLLQTTPSLLAGGRLLVSGDGTLHNLHWDGDTHQISVRTDILLAASGSRPFTIYTIALEQKNDGADRDMSQALQHDIRNTLSIIRSLFRRTATNSDSVDELVSHFLGRLDSFLRLQSNPLLNESFGVELSSLILDELSSHVAHIGHDVTVSGPNVTLRGSAAVTLGLVMHELATNSVKFGALGTDGTRLDISWAILPGGGEPALAFLWKEQDVPLTPVIPVHEGFGTEMLTQSLPFELRATSDINRRADGIEISISVPMAEITY